MPSESQANKARKEHANRLRDLGAHAIGVDNIPGTTSFGITAYVTNENIKMPESVHIKDGDKTVTVPIRTKTTQKFQAE